MLTAIRGSLFSSSHNKFPITSWMHLDDGKFKFLVNPGLQRKLSFKLHSEQYQLKSLITDELAGGISIQ